MKVYFLLYFAYDTPTILNVFCCRQRTELKQQKQESQYQENNKSIPQSSASQVSCVQVS